jgi:hypothetical protein
LNITCNFLYCNDQVNRDFLITLYVCVRERVGFTFPLLIIVEKQSVIFKHVYIPTEHIVKLLCAFIYS